MVRILAVDTSSTRGSVCIAENGEMLGEVRLASSLQHSERLFKSIEFLFQHMPFTLAEIDHFVAACGPGSFTGLRIGLAATDGFAAAHGKKGAGVSTLQALAWKTGICNNLVVPIIDARRGEVYSAMYQRTGVDFVEVRQPTVSKPEEWLSSLPDSPLTICGEGANRYRDMMASKPKWTFYNTDPYLACSIAEMALTSNVGPLKPLYVRKTDAEIAIEQRHESIAGPNS